LGIKKTVFLDLPTAKLDTFPQKELNDLISACIKQVAPEILYIPFLGDISKDHKLIAEASLVASRPKPESSVKRVLMYEVLSETEWGTGHFQKSTYAFLPNYYEDIKGFIDDKLKAMLCYKSELKKYPHPRSLKGIKILAQKRGMEAGLKYAESFILQRETR